MGCALFVIGPAGSGKTTFCRSLAEHGATLGRSFGLVNLDPASIDEAVPYVVDIREYIALSDVLENTDMGPNGGLMLALSELSQNIQEMELEGLCGEYLVFDCPGQLEVFTHSDVICKISGHVRRHFSSAVVYLMESQFLLDAGKYVHGCLTALIAMSRLELPHMNVLTKVDLVGADGLYAAERQIRNELCGPGTYMELALKIYDFLDENGALSFRPLDWNDEDSVFGVLYEIDMLTQYHEDAEPLNGSD